MVGDEARAGRATLPCVAPCSVPLQSAREPSTFTTERTDNRPEVHAKHESIDWGVLRTGVQVGGASRRRPTESTSRALWRALLPRRKDAVLGFHGRQTVQQWSKLRLRAPGDVPDAAGARDKQRQVDP